MREEYPQPVVLDATVVSNFASTDRISTLVASVAAPVVVPSVRREIEQGIEEGHGYLDSAVAAIGETISVQSVSAIEDHAAIRDQLDDGESQSLVRVIEQGGTLATDDLAARRLATDNGVPVTGSVGILVLAVERGHLDVSTADEWLAVWRDVRGYYAPVASVSELIDDPS